MVNCGHFNISWDFSQFNPDYGICQDCGLQVIARNANSTVYEEGSKEFYKLRAEFGFGNDPFNETEDED